MSVTTKDENTSARLPLAFSIHHRCNYRCASSSDPAFGVLYETHQFIRPQMEIGYNKICLLPCLHLLCIFAYLLYTSDWKELIIVIRPIRGSIFNLLGFCSGWLVLAEQKKKKRHATDIILPEYLSRVNVADQSENMYCTRRCNIE